jgi:predicted RNA binding protein YcfA (HicA-like mRNA interferase family)
MLKPISGKKCVKIICNKFNFKIIRQKGSHIVLKNCDNPLIGTVIPNHPSIKNWNFTRNFRIGQD